MIMQNTTKKLLVWACVVVLLLMIPFLAMQFNVEVIDPGNPTPEHVNWSPGDFVFAGLLLFAAGLVYILTTRNMNNGSKRFLVGLAVFFVLAFIWVAAATGFERFLG